jgi:hypothetical protein
MSLHLGKTSRLTYPNITYVAGEAIVVEALLTCWASQIRTWVTAAYVHCGDRGSVFAIILCGQREVWTFFIPLEYHLSDFHRFYCRIVFTKKVGLDDYFIALALLVVTILAIFNGFQISWGVG